MSNRPRFRMAAACAIVALFFCAMATTASEIQAVGRNSFGGGKVNIRSSATFEWPGRMS